MDPAAAAKFVARWKLVHERELEELRNTPLEEKWRQLCALFDSARALGWETEDPQEVEAVRRRWRRLRDHYGV